jgi:hypothetical protein
LSGGAWLKGNLHAHTTHSDGQREPQAVVDSYAERGYDFLALTDHDILTTESDHALLDSRGMILIAGNEITANGPHMLHIGATSTVKPSSDRQTVIDDIRRCGGFAVVNHPNWFSDFNHCSFDQLCRWQGYGGMEIYNGVIEQLPGSAYALDKWDRILSTGCRVWGFANDDSHAAEGQDALGWSVAYVSERTPAAIVDALSRGRFYASTGVAIDDIRVDGDRIVIRAGNADRIAAFIRDGSRHAYTNGCELSVTIPPAAVYVRFECCGAAGSRAWTQPFFVRGE